MGRLNDALKTLGAKITGVTPKGKQPSEIINGIAASYRIEVSGINTLSSAQCESLPMGAVVIDTSNKLAFSVAEKTDSSLVLICAYIDSTTPKIYKQTYAKSEGTWSASGSMSTYTLTVST